MLGVESYKFYSLQPYRMDFDSSLICLEGFPLVTQIHLFNLLSILLHIERIVNGSYSAYTLDLSNTPEKKSKLHVQVKHI